MEHDRLRKPQKNDNLIFNQSKQSSLPMSSHAANIIQRLSMHPQSISSADVRLLQKVIGNRAIGQLMKELGAADSISVQEEVGQGQFDNISINDDMGLDTISGIENNSIVSQKATTGSTGVLQCNLATYEGIDAANKSEHPIIENRKFNASPKSGPFGNSSDTGLGVSRSFNFSQTTVPENATINFLSKITWDASVKDSSGSEEGKHMIADPIGPDHKRGSEPGSSGDWVARRIALSSAAGKHEYIAGHLLNADLGGPGNTPENLAAIPDEINKAHDNKIEETVKKEVNRKGGWGKYEVTINHSIDADSANLLYASNLKAEWTPYALVRTPIGLGKYNYSLELAQGEKTTMDQGIPAPSIYKKQSSPKSAKAKISDAKTTNTGSTYFPLYTPFEFNELPLTKDTQKIVSYGLENVLLIKQLKNQGKDASEQIQKLSQHITEYEDKLHQLELQKAELLSKYMESEVEIYLTNQRLQAEMDLNKKLKEQIVQLKKMNQFFMEVAFGDDLIKENPELKMVYDGMQDDKEEPK